MENDEKIFIALDIQIEFWLNLKLGWKLHVSLCSDIKVKQSDSRATLYWKKKNQFLIFDHSYVKCFHLIDDKHIVINNESPFHFSIHRATFQSIFRILPPSFTSGAFRSKNLIKLKWKSICFRESFGFILLNVIFTVDCPPFSHSSNLLILPSTCNYIKRALCKYVTRHFSSAVDPYHPWRQCL